MPEQRHHQIHYLEIPTPDIAASKAFFEDAFDWRFVDYGPDYTCFVGQQIEGGFFTSAHAMNSEQGSALVVLYSKSLEDSLSKVQAAAGTIKQSIFSFPGGRRFHFVDPSGNEFAVWSE
ncbi:VOC family protein [Glaciecola sp. SC05]|uniref:VOC family protein n=1 Tax=Glaciecola sp. SC05 TaxID=1987355 RepID=UPI0035272F7C